LNSRNINWFICILLIFIVSCTKDDYETKRNNIIGEWDGNNAVQEFRADTLHSEAGTEINIILNADGSGEVTRGLPQTFDWYYQLNPEKIVLILEEIFIATPNEIVLEVEKNEADRQIWSYTLDNPPGNIADKYEYTWTLEPK